MIEEDYTLYKKKFSLPEFNKLDEEFDLQQADSDYILKNIRKQMQDKIEFLSDIFADVLQPTPESFPQMHECEHITEEEKVIVFQVYKKLQYFLRMSHEANLINTDEVNAEFIKEFSKTFGEIKQKSVPILTSLKQAWKKAVQTDEVIGYFG